MDNLLVVYDRISASCSDEQFSAFLSVHKLVSSWSIPFSGLCVLKTTAHANDLLKDFYRITGAKQVFIATLNVRETGGRMPPGFWEWFKADEVTPELIQAIKDGLKG